jgi:AmmeMemoRadiSam system protein B
MARTPAVAGSFYEASPRDLKKTVQTLVARPGVAERAAIGMIAPHAAYAFSGRVAGDAYARVAVPRTAVVLGPNHTGLGHPAAVGTASPWIVPVGRATVATDVAARILKRCKDLAADDVAHAAEHAIEVQIPLLLEKNPAVRIVPVCLRTMSFDACERIGNGIAAALADLDERALLVASSDMNHHEPLRVAARKDQMALDRVRELDARGLYEAVVEHHVSMCGFVPAVVTLVAARAMGARCGEVVSYTTSADVDGDSSSVVGYAGVVLLAERPRMAMRSLRD